MHVAFCSHNRTLYWKGHERKLDAKEKIFIDMGDKEQGAPVTEGVFSMLTGFQELSTFAPTQKRLRLRGRQTRGTATTLGVRPAPFPLCGAWAARLPAPCCAPLFAPSPPRPFPRAVAGAGLGRWQLCERAHTGGRGAGGRVALKLPPHGT